MSLTLRYPTTGSPVNEAVLPDPMIGDIDSSDLGIVHRKNRGGEAISVRGDDWPLTETNKYKFTCLTGDEKDALTAFLAATVGLAVLCIDHNNISWIGVIPDSSIEFITLEDGCTYDTSFTFMGTKQ
jgi:hypothetical protein